jgi:dTDP-4-amino-4,6-dideoxygalactose transaminase
MATPLATMQAGAEIVFVDCNRFDLCMSFEDMKQKAEKHKPAAIWVVHIGGHLAFEIEKIADYCKHNNIILLEDCAHAAGAEWNGKKPGEWGDAGFYSFYATKTITTGEGGMLVTKHKELLEHAKKFRNYGKFDYKVKGLNYRITEFAAAIGAIETDRLKEIINFKNDYANGLDTQYSNRVKLPEGMISGYYKYIVFDEIEKSTGKVYEEQCHRVLGHKTELPNSDWVSKNHWCVPIYYNP